MRSVIGFQAESPDDDWVEKAETGGDNETESYASGHVIHTEQTTEQTCQLHEKVCSNTNLVDLEVLMQILNIL